MSDELNPETFNLDEWLTDAHLPEVSTRVFKGGHLVAKLQKVEAEIRDEQAVVGQSLQAAQRLTQLREEYEQLLEEFGRSALTVYLQALPGEKLRALRRSFDDLAKAHKWNTAESSAEFGYYLVANSLVAVEPADGERQSVSMTPADLKGLESKIGPGEWGKLLLAYKDAQGALKEPDTDFLHKSSGSDSSDTES